MNIIELINRLKDGDNNAFMEVYDYYYGGLHVFIKRYVHSEHVSEDLTQDVFVKLWEKRSYLSEVTSFNSYIYRMAKNHTLDYLKKVSRLEIMPHELISEFQFSSNEVEMSVREQEYFEFLNNYMKTLPERSQKIFKMCREQEKSYEEVAQTLNISKSTVKHHMVATMRKISKEIVFRFQLDRFNLVFLLLLYQFFLN